MTDSRRLESASLHIIGITLAFCGAGLLVSALVELLIGDTNDWVSLSAVGVASAVSGWLIWSFVGLPVRIHRLDVFAAVTSAWLAMSVVGAIPYLATGTLTDLDLALFESVSGFSTTGATVLQAGDDPTRYDASLGILFWRSISQWRCSR